MRWTLMRAALAETVAGPGVRLKEDRSRSRSLGVNWLRHSVSSTLASAGFNPRYDGIGAAIFSCSDDRLSRGRVFLCSRRRFRAIPKKKLVKKRENTTF